MAISLPKAGISGWIILLFFVNICQAQVFTTDTSNSRSSGSRKQDSIKLQGLLKLIQENKQSDPANAVSYCTTAIQLSKALGKKKTQAEVQNTAGQCYAYLNRQNESEKSFTAALGIYRELDDSLGMAKVHNNLGNHYRSLSDLNQAITQYEKSVQIEEALGEKASMATTLTNMGIIYQLRGDYSQALKLHLKALALSEESGKQGHLAHVFRNIGIVYSSLKEYDKALDYYQLAMEKDEQQGDQRGFAMNLVNMALCYKAQSRFDRTLEDFFRALKVFEKIGIKRDIATVLNNIASLCYQDLADSTYERLKAKGLFGKQEAGGENKYTTAMRFIQRSMEIQNGRRNTIEYASALYLMGDCNREIGNFDQALYYSTESLSLADSLNALHVKELVLVTLTDIYEATGEYTKAYTTFKTYCSIKDSLDNLNTRVEMTRLELQYAYDRKEKDITHQKEVSDLLARQATDQLQQQLLLTRSREQELLLQDKALEVSNKEKDLHRLAFLKKKAELNGMRLEINNKEERLRGKENEIALQKLSLSRKSLQRNILIIGTLLCLVTIFFIFRNYKNQRKSNQQLFLMNEEISDINTRLSKKNKELLSTLDHLQQTQEQLIKTEKNKETEIIRRRISLDIHDDISSSLTRIAWLSEMAKEKISQEDLPDAAAALNKIVASSRETIDRLGEIIWAINPDRDDMEAFFSYLRVYISRFIDEFPLKVIMNFPAESVNYRFNPQLKRTLFLVIKEALHNIVKHAEASTIEIQISCDEKRYAISMADDGKGFDFQRISDHADGLQNMKNRMASIRGNAEIHSRPGEGTRVFLKGEIYS